MSFTWQDQNQFAALPYKDDHQKFSLISFNQTPLNSVVFLGAQIDNALNPVLKASATSRLKFIGSISFPRAVTAVIK
ncbi:MAG TPA: hypothetical protein VJX74_11340 [Blastocatellia bacterium]|nr:hypothetical protein [Blastocatellia bacterium]